MKSLYNILLVLSVLFAACGQSNSTSATATTKATQKEYENFPDFFQAFGSDTAYQLAHITFPLLWVEHIIDEDEPIRGSVQQADWLFIDFVTESSDSPPPFQEFTTEFARPDSNTVLYTRKGIDNGIFMEFTFQLTNGGWMMVKVEDFST